MRLNIVNNRKIIIDLLTTPEEDAIRKHLSVKVPQFRHIKTSNTSWDGYFRKYNPNSKSVSRAFQKDLEKFGNDKGFPVVTADHREPEKNPPDLSRINKEMLPGITLDDFQVEAIKAGCKEEVGIIKLPTGSGKTEIMAAHTMLLPGPTIIIAEQTIVIEQIKRRLELREVVEEVGMFCAGKTPTNTIVVVGLIQSLQSPKAEPKLPLKKQDESDSSFKKKLVRYAASLKAYKTRLKNSKLLQQLVKQANTLLVDECDLASSDLYKLLFKSWFSGRRVIGYSGTPFEDSKPVEGLTLRERIGDIIYEEERETVQKLGRIIPIEYIMLVVGPDDTGNRATLDIAYKEQVVYNLAFHQMVNRIVTSTPDSDGTLILVERDELGLALADLIEGSAFIHGPTPNKKRSEIIERFEARDLKCLIGGKIVNRALDLRGGCEDMILTAGGKMYSNFDQKLGRAVRVNKNGKGRVWDFFWLGNHYTYRHSCNRLKFVVNKLGYKARVIFPNGEISGQQFVKSRFRRPKF